MRKAKIVDTIGPSTESPEGITKLVEAGMDVARLNRSHGTPEDHLKVYNNVRAASKATGRNVAAMVDLQGPKIRCGWFKKNAEGEDKVQLEEGQEFIITTDDVEGDEHITSTTFKGLPGDCHPGDPILIDDGKVRLEVTKVEGNNVHTKVVVAGPVSSHKGINLPGVAVSLPALTEKDEADLRWAIRTGADIIAMSFVRFATDIDRAHEIMDEEGRRIPIVAKIEKPQALENLEDIVKTFDGVMAARGDMAVECPLEEVPLATKRIIELARQYAKPVIVATEVLGSMVHSPVPSRAEASDCANAVLDGADATMTSNETAVGEYPTETVATMSRISGFATEHGFDRIPELKNLDMSSTGAVSSAAVDLAEKLNAKAIVAYTQTGNTVHRVSRERPAAPIYGLTTNEHTYHWLALSWGTEAFLLDEDYHDKTRKDLMAFTDKVLKNAGKVSDGDKIVVLSSAQGEHAAGLTGQVFQHDAGFEVFVRIVSAAAAARQLAFRVEGQGVLFFHHVQNVRLRASFFQPGQLFFPDYGVLGQLFRNGGGEAFFQPDEVKNVADVHEPEEFVFGHDFTERAETLRRTQIVDPRRGSLFELVDAHGADIGFVGRVGLRFLIGLGVLRQCAQEFGIRFALALLSGRAAVVQG